MAGSKGRAQVIKAFAHHAKRKIGNYHSDGETLRVFGNTVARWREGTYGDRVYLTDAGWRTRTTKEALSDILWWTSSHWHHLRQIKHGWFLTAGEDAVPWTGSLEYYAEPVGKQMHMWG